MSQTHPHKGEQSLGAAAAAAAASNNKPSDKPADKPSDKPVGSSGTPANTANGNAGTSAAGAEKKKREVKRKVFIVRGDLNTDNILEFDSVVQAEKFLNGGTPDVPAAYTVIQGVRAKKSTRVSLR